MLYMLVQRGHAPLSSAAVVLLVRGAHARDCILLAHTDLTAAHSERC